MAADDPRQVSAGTVPRVRLGNTVWGVEVSRVVIVPIALRVKSASIAVDVKILIQGRVPNAHHVSRVRI